MRSAECGVGCMKTYTLPTTHYLLLTTRCLPLQRPCSDTTGVSGVEVVSGPHFAINGSIALCCGQAEYHSAQVCEEQGGGGSSSRTTPKQGGWGSRTTPNYGGLVTCMCCAYSRWDMWHVDLHIVSLMCRPGRGAHQRAHRQHPPGQKKAAARLQKITRLCRRSLPPLRTTHSPVQSSTS